MEAATELRALPELRRRRAAETELEQLRSLGEAYLLRRFGGSVGRADAEDAVADVIIRLHRRIEGDRAPDNLRAAFFTSVRNAAIDQLRSRAARPTVALEAAADHPAPTPAPAEHAESGEDAVRLQEALARMRGNYREAIILRFGIGLTVPEISKRLQISLPAAKKLVLRATEQARRRLIAIEGHEFCPEMQDQARRAIFDKEAAGLACESERRALQAHFKHCGSCKTFLARLHTDLHQVGGALLAGATVQRSGLGDQLARWFDHRGHAIHAAAAKLRLTALKTTGAFQGGDAGGAGLLAGTGQKIAAICTAGAATTATCLASGIVGPGLGVATHHASQPVAHHAPAPIHRLISELPPAQELPSEAEPAPEPTEAPESGPSANAVHAGGDSAPPEDPVPTPSQAASEEFGFESSTSSESTSEPTPPPAAPPPVSSNPPSSGGGSHAAGTETFGFGG